MIAWIKSTLMTGQHFLKKEPINPSGPDAFLGGMSLITASISRAVKGASRSSRSCYL